MQGGSLVVALLPKGKGVLSIPFRPWPVPSHYLLVVHWDKDVCDQGWNCRKYPALYYCGLLLYDQPACAHTHVYMYENVINHSCPTACVQGWDGWVRPALLKCGLLLSDQPARMQARMQGWRWSCTEFPMLHYEVKNIPVGQPYQSEW